MLVCMTGARASVRALRLVSLWQRAAAPTTAEEGRACAAELARLVRLSGLVVERRDLGLVGGLLSGHLASAGWMLWADVHTGIIVATPNQIFALRCLMASFHILFAVSAADVSRLFLRGDTDRVVRHTAVKIAASYLAVGISVAISQRALFATRRAMVLHAGETNVDAGGEEAEHVTDESGLYNVVADHIVATQARNVEASAALLDMNQRRASKDPMLAHWMQLF